MIDKINTMDKAEDLINVHSMCLNRECVPRVFIQEPIQFDNGTLKLCLASNTEEFAASSNKTLHDFEFKRSDFLDKNDLEKTIIVEYVFQRIQDLFGWGIIHYEMARFTPFTKESCENYISHFVGEIDLQLTKSLANRLKSMEAYTSKYPHFYKYSTTRPHLIDMLSSVMINKINTEWQKTWLVESRYIDVDSHDIIGGVLGNEQSS